MSTLERSHTLPSMGAWKTPLVAVANTPTRVVLALTRVVLGFYFLWAFLDKTFGLHFSTPTAKAWIRGGSPTTGYLKGVAGPFKGVFNSIAGNTAVDWLFMIGLLGIGVALILGVGMRIAAVSSLAMLTFMYLASLPLTTNPVIDDHVIEALGILVVVLVGAGDAYGLGTWWKGTKMVQRFRWLA
ncbi:hypothetical protein GCM10025864_16310 [Luteimicrobium album]|uniref:Thiosulfate dehydrogenase [quinone] large subunit n=1 Tax=Luteimicrobium album TaxID=1054550 RepID=A0ABQ6I0A1_9MICO|nr:hypothetical protein [Luteimicrobium album]GMA23872.1 hypothetical protein GCM10025864_16310 [Luteimicrobium album]